MSDRTPLPLLPGALSLVEARPSEVDIRISVPQGAQDYLRLGWREIGGQPTFRVVSGVSDGPVLTITGLEQGTEYDVRASLMTFQGFDLCRVGNSGAPLSLIPDGRPDSEWIRNLASGGLGKSQTIRVMSAYRSSLSIANVRESEDVGDMVFEVTLSEASDDVVTVDWTTSSDTAETPADYQAESGTLTFPAGEIAQTLTVTINNDMVDEEEEETFTVTLTNAVNAMIEDASATGTITDDDVPSVTASFGQGSYTVVEGSTVTVTLSADPERSVTIPITKANQGTTSPGDYSGVPANVTFVAGDTEETITFSATQDTVDDDVESVKLTFGSSLPTGVTKGSTDEAIVSITDDDVPSVTVSFEQGSYTVAEGSAVTVKVKLDADPERTVTIPITATDQDGASGDDYSGVPASVTFVPGDTEETITFSATQDTVDEDDESVKLTFGALPTGVTAGTTNEATVTITDDDVPSVTVSFEQGSYTVDEGSTVTVKVKLDADPERTVTIPITATDQDEASGDDYSVVPASVTFVAGDTEETITFSATQDTVDDDVESVKLTFGSSLPTGVTAGTTNEATVTITDDDVPSVEVSFGQGSYTVAEGDTVEVTVTLSEDPERSVTIPLSTANQGGASDSDYSGVPPSVAFASGQTEKTFTFSAAEDNLEDSSESVKLSFVTLPDKVTTGTTDEATVRISNKVAQNSLTVTFEFSDQMLSEGGTATVKVRLNIAPGSDVTIPLTKTEQGRASSADYSGVPANVKFASSETEKSFTFTAAQDTVDDDDESVKLGFGTLPLGVSAGSTAETTMFIAADDVPSVAVSFEQGSYTVDEGSTVTVKVKLDADPERTVTIPITKANQGGASGGDYSGVPASVTFVPGDTEVDVSFSAASDGENDDGESVKLTFGNTLPTGVSAGTTNEATVTITDDDVPAVTVSFEQATYVVAEGSSVTVKVTLNMDPERTVTFPITKTNQDGATDSDYTIIPSSVTFNGGDTEKTFIFEATSDDENDDGESVKVGFGPLPTDVSAGITNETVVTITDDDVPWVTVSFEQGSYTVTEGDTVEVTVTLSEDPEQSVTIPLSTANQGGASGGDYSGVPASVTFVPGDTEVDVSFSAASDGENDDGESVKLTFGNTLPTGVSAGTTNEATVTLTDDDVPSVTVSFEQATYMVAEGSSVTVKVTLNMDPERTVTFPITKTNQDGATDSDYTIIPSSVTFNRGETEKSFTFTAAQDTVDDDDESVKLGFGTLPLGVSAGSTTETTMFITDDDVPSVAGSFEQGSYTVDEGSTVTVKVKLDADPERTVTIPITKANQGGALGGDYSGVPASVTFVPGDTEVDISFSAASDGENDDGESVKLTFGALPDGVTMGSTDEATVSITDDDAIDLPLTSVQVSFGGSAFTVPEGSSVEVTINLSADPERSVTIPLTRTNQDGASNDDYSGVPDSVTFNSGETEKTFYFTATQDSVQEDGESVRLTFGALPDGVTTGSPDEATVLITDDDAMMEVSFERSDYSVNEGHGVEVMVKLDPAPDHRMDIQLQKTNMNGASDGDYFGIPSMLTFGRGETEKSFTFFAEPDNESDDGETVMLSFAALPAMVQEGAPSEATVTLRDSESLSQDGLTCIDNNRANIVTVLSARGEISSPGEIDSLVIPDVDPYRTYFVEILGADSNVDIWGQNVGGGSLTLAAPHPVSLFHGEWEGTSGTSGFNPGGSDGGTGHNARFIFSGFGDYVLRVESGDENGTGSYHVLVRYSNYCILRADGSILFPYEGGPEGYAFDVRDDTDTKSHAYDQDRGPSYYASGGNVLGDNWDSGPDEDWIRLDLKADTEYKFYLEADSDVPVTHQLTRPQIVGIYDTDGDEVHEGAAGSGTDTSVSLTLWDRHVR